MYMQIAELMFLYLDNCWCYSNLFGPKINVEGNLLAFYKLFCNKHI